MRAIFLVALLAAPGLAAGPGQKPRTLAEIVDRALREGQEEYLSEHTAGKLGLGETRFPLRKARYKQSVSPDRKEHTLAVLFRKADASKDEPLHLLFTVGTGKKEGDVVQIESNSFLSDLKGNLRAALHTHGPLSDVTVDAIKVDPSLRKRLRAEIDFHRRVAPSLGLKPAE